MAFSPVFLAGASSSVQCCLPLSPAVTAGAGLLLAALIGAVALAYCKRSASPDMPWRLAVLRVVLSVLLRLRYKLDVSGLENVPKDGAVILAANHTAYLDVILLPVLCRRYVRYLSWAEYEKMPVMHLIMRFCGTIPISSTKAKDAMSAAVKRLRNGECIGIFPEGQITRNGNLGAFQGGCALMARRADVPVVPVFIDGLWASSLSYYFGGFFKRPPRLGRPWLAVRFGKPILPADVDTLRDKVQVLGAELYAKRPVFRRHLGHEIVKSLARHPGKILVVDRGGPVRAAFRGATLLALARWCALHLKKTAPEQRIGILLPPGVATTVANIACVMIGKSPVNLNFTLGRAQLEACIATTNLKTFITAKALRDKLDEKVSDFPWASMERIIDIATLLKSAPKSFLISRIVASWILPGRLLCALWGVPYHGGTTEATVLCTSGSSGQPKGVPLTHANVLGNCNQFDETRLVPPHAILLGNLPIFHSFGFTVTLWFALTRGIRVVNTPSPLEYTRNITAIREEKATILISTPTFFRGYMKKASREEMASVQLVVGGAEKTPAGFVEEWETRFSGRYHEGYGATEATPVVGVNLRDVHDPRVRDGLFVGRRTGSIGRLLCGIAARFTNPMTGEPSTALEGGVLWIKGVNVFQGYLGDPVRTREALTPDGWYCTGDIARTDDEGFVYIEGRQARFSKIGGEMVPHGTIEDAVRKALGMHFGDDAVQRLAIAARFDEAKGESLVLLTTIEIDADALRTALTNSGLSNLWIPRVIKRVDAIPVLATGKLDLQRLRQLAEEA